MHSSLNKIASPFLTHESVALPASAIRSTSDSPLNLSNPRPGVAVRTEETLDAKSMAEWHRTEHLRKNLPHGIIIGCFNDARGKPFYVRWTSPSGALTKRPLVSFSTERERNDRAEELAKAKENEGESITDFNIADLKALRALKQLMGPSDTLSKVVEVWRLYGYNKDFGISVSHAIKRYAELRAKEGLSADTYRHDKVILGRFEETYGNYSMAAIRSSHVEEWMDALKEEYGFGAMTIRNHRKHVSTLFERAMLKEWCARNPCAAAPVPVVDDKDKKILTIRDAFQLLKANIDNPVTPKLALEMFGGLRCSSVEQITKDHVRFEDRGIYMPGPLHKTRKKKYRQGHPSVLWSWLDAAPESTWTEITPANYDDRKREAFIKAGVQNPGNVLRNSCVSHFLAIKKDYGVVGYMMQHSSQNITAGYEGVASEKDAELYMALTPEMVRLSFEEFVGRIQPGRALPVV